MSDAERLDRRLAEDLSRLSRQPLEPGALDTVKVLVLDAIANAIEGSTHPAANVASRATVGNSGRNTVIRRSDGISAPDAAFVHSVMIHSTLRDDVGGGGFSEGTHPSSYVIPAALAVAEDRGLSGLDFLTAVVVGYEAAGRIGAAAPSSILARGYRAVPVIGVFGAAAATASLLKFDPDVLESAFAAAVHLSGGLYRGMMLGTMEPFLHAGFSARNGVYAGLLAEAGAVTADDPLAGPGGWCEVLGGEAGQWSESPGTSLAIHRVKHKVFPVNGIHHTTMALIVAGLRGRPKWEEADIEHVLVRRPKAGPDRIEPTWLQDPPYENMLQAQLSAKFTTIAALLDRPVSELAYYRDHFDDPGVRAVIERSSFVAGERTDIEIVVSLRSGESVRLAAEQGFGKAGPDVVQGRFLSLTSAYLGDRAEAVRTLVGSLETLDDVQELTAYLRTDRVPRSAT
jgi:2-methylcitrate dehydratase PrpD